jgi:hypothetical protein
MTLRKFFITSYPSRGNHCRAERPQLFQSFCVERFFVQQVCTAWIYPSGIAADIAGSHQLYKQDFANVIVEKHHSSIAKRCQNAVLMI